MNPTPIPDQVRAHAPALAAKLALILADLGRLIFARCLLLGPLAIPLNNRVAGVARRLAALLAHLAAGRLPRLYAPRPKAEDGTRHGGPPPTNLPTRRAWIVVTLGHHAAGYASQLQFLLNDPQTLATLAAAPPQAVASIARTLRPLCRRLGVDLPAILQPPPPPPRPPAPPKPARPKPAPLPPLLPLYPQRKPRPYPFLTPLRKFRPA